MTIISGGGNLGTSGGTLVACGAANTKGSWVELIASTSAETYWLQLALKGLTSSNDENYLIDIGYGDVGGGNEVVAISNISVFLNAGFGLILPPMPFTVPTTKALVVRGQATQGSEAFQAQITLSDDNSYGTSTSNETIGANTGASIGTDVVPSATNNTKGNYSELSASTGIDYNYFVLCVGNSDNPTTTTNNILIDVATGSAASEVDIITSLMHTITAAEPPSMMFANYETIASGTRISARCQASASATDLNDATIDAVLIGFNITAPAGGSGNQGISQGLHSIGSQISA